jgi:hypothetical protein
LNGLLPLAKLLRTWRRDVEGGDVPLVISGNGRCALLTIGPAIRLYDLEGKRLIRELLFGDFVPLTGRYIAGGYPYVSQNGDYIVVSGNTTRPDELMARERKNGGTHESEFGLRLGSIEMRVHAPSVREPVRTIDVPVISLPPAPVTAATMTPLAIDPNGRWLVVDRLDIDKDSENLLLSRKIAVIDLQSGSTTLEILPEPWNPYSFDPKDALRAARSAAFSPDGSVFAIRVFER